MCWTPLNRALAPGTPVHLFYLCYCYHSHLVCIFLNLLFTLFACLKVLFWKSCSFSVQKANNKDLLFHQTQVLECVFHVYFWGRLFEHCSTFVQSIAVFTVHSYIYTRELATANTVLSCWQLSSNRLGTTCQAEGDLRGCCLSLASVWEFTSWTRTSGPLATTLVFQHLSNN